MHSGVDTEKITILVLLYTVFFKELGDFEGVELKSLKEIGLSLKDQDSPGANNEYQLNLDQKRQTYRRYQVDFWHPEILNKFAYMHGKDIESLNYESLVTDNKKLLEIKN